MAKEHTPRWLISNGFDLYKKLDRWEPLQAAAVVSGIFIDSVSYVEQDFNVIKNLYYESVYTTEMAATCLYSGNNFFNHRSSFFS